MQIKNTVFFALTLFFASALAGCGGGGGGSSGGSGNRVSLNTLNNAVDTSTTRTAARNFAGATPRAGSVTQTSNTDNDGVTQDTIAADARYGAGGELVVTVRRTDNEGAAIALGNDGNSPGTVVVAREDNLRSLNNNEYRGRILGRATGGGIAFTQVFTDRLTQADTDYLVGGVWLFIPGGAASTRDLEIGAFADGPDANLTPAAYLTTAATATYRGDAHGLYLGRDTSGELGGEFQGNVRLTATFGGTPSIFGSISGFQERTIGQTDFSSLAGDPALMLERAAIDGASAGGFFTGNTRATAPMGGATRTFSGKWGGQFYGGQADSVGGTFGGSTSGNADGYELNFIGVFGAYKQ